MLAVKEVTLPASDGSVDLSHGSIQFIGTATVIIRYAGFTILTDPNFLHRGEAAHLGYGLRSKRLTDPGIEWDDLPPIDLIVLSHLHEDHFDRTVERRLDRRMPIVTTPEAARALERKGFTATVALPRWGSVVFTKPGARLRISAMPGRHGPWLVSSLLPSVMGSMLEFQDGGGGHLLRLYITGDTLLHAALREIPRRYAEIDTMLLHLGGTRVVGVLVTMDGRQGVEALKWFRPRVGIPIHYNDYTVFKSPLDEFRAEVITAGLHQVVRYLAHGQTYSFRVPSPTERRSHEHST
jgi:L-ascorbate metabolism protein UlaG (beta-lactamase superfamily)